jgi:hypothetical protein
MFAGVKQNQGLLGRAAIVCALCFPASACSDDGTTGQAGKPAPDAAGDGNPCDACADAAVLDAHDGSEDGGAEAATDAGGDSKTDGAPDAPAPIDAADAASADAAADGANEAGVDGADAQTPDASDAAADAAPRCSTLDCDDRIGCTVDVCDEMVGCIHTPTNELCDDNRVCSGIETCNPASGCEPGTPLGCNDSNRCTFDYCSEPAGGCAHHDVSASVELLINADFDYGENLGWLQFPLFRDGSLIWEDPQLAHTPDWFAWLGGQPSIGMRLWQAVEVPADATELTLSGVYSLIPGEGAPSLSSYFRIEINDALTGADYERALSLGSNQTTPLEWVPFSLTTSEPHAGKALEIMILSQNAANDSTNFTVDTLSLRAKVCPAQ